MSLRSEPSDREADNRRKGDEPTTEQKHESHHKKSFMKLAEHKLGRTGTICEQSDKDNDKVAEIFYKEQGPSEEPDRNTDRREDPSDRRYNQSLPRRYEVSHARRDETRRQNRTVWDRYRPSYSRHTNDERDQYDRGERYRYRDRSPTRTYHHQEHRGRDYHSERDQRHINKRERSRSIYRDREYGYRSRSPRRYNDREDKETAPLGDPARGEDDAEGQPAYPHTTYSLSDYTKDVKASHTKGHDPYLTGVEDLSKFKNGDGKVNPTRYGSTLEHDLGLCFATFVTNKGCEMGQECPWRHHPLTATERLWIRRIAGESGSLFIEETDKVWGTPYRPDPGANMWTAMKRYRD